jgi:hypothetical protein
MPVGPCDYPANLPEFNILKALSNAIPHEPSRMGLHDMVMSVATVPGVSLNVYVYVLAPTAAYRFCPL